MATEGRLTFLFDENTPHRLVFALRHLGEAAFHVHDVGLKQAPDEIVLGHAGERDWCFVTGDRRILHRKHERAVISEMGIGAFFLNDSLQGLCSISRAVFRNRPEMKRLGAREPHPFLFVVRETTVKRLSLRHLG